MYRHCNPERLRPTLVHGNDEQGDFPTTFIEQACLSSVMPARKSGVPAYTVVINMRAELEDHRRWRQWLKISERRLALISQLDAVVACSRDIEHRLLERGVFEKKVVYIPICVDPAQFGPAESDSAKAYLRGKLGLRDGPTIAYVGEVTERKGAHLLFQALREVAASQTGWQLVIARPRNDEQYARQLEAYVDDQGWREHVHFLGHVNNIEAVYKSADKFCLPSRDEGMPEAHLVH